MGFGRQHQRPKTEVSTNLFVTRLDTATLVDPSTVKVYTLMKVDNAVMSNCPRTSSEEVATIPVAFITATAFSAVARE